MAKFDGKEHQEFFAKFMKASIITTILVIIIISSTLVFFNILNIKNLSLWEKKILSQFLNYLHYLIRELNFLLLKLRKVF